MRALAAACALACAVNAAPMKATPVEATPVEATPVEAAPVEATPSSPSLPLPSLASSPSPPLLLTSTSPSDESSDLNAIPPSILTVPPPPSPPSSQHSSSLNASTETRFFLESALTTWHSHSPLPVPPPASQPTYQERLSADATATWRPTTALSLTLSDRLSTFAANGISFPSSAVLRNDLREAYASYEVAPQAYVDIGRINLKNGPALGYNPTDYFKARTQVDLASIDPSASKQDRLGVLMIEAQKLFTGGAITLAFAPDVQHPTKLLAGAPAPFDPRFGQTNASPRYLASLSYDILGLSPQLLVFHDDIGTHVGASLSRVMSNNLVLYAEWSGADTGTLTRRAIDFGKATGSLPADAPLLSQSSTTTHFQNDAAIGASWTTDYRLTVNLEFHYHESAFTRHDFVQGIALGRSNTRLADEFWFIRTYAMDQEEPLMRQQLFARLDWQDAFIQYLDLDLVSFVNPFDRSTLVQLSAQYALSKHWTFGLYFTAALGRATQEKSSIPWSQNAVLQLVRYF